MLGVVLVPVEAPPDAERLAELLVFSARADHERGVRAEPRTLPVVFRVVFVVALRPLVHGRQEHLFLDELEDEPRRPIPRRERRAAPERRHLLAARLADAREPCGREAALARGGRDPGTLRDPVGVLDFDGVEDGAPDEAHEFRGRKDFFQGSLGGRQRD